MKILFLHISDIHINEKTDINYFHLKKLTDSLQATGGFDYTIIIVTGDIAKSGKAHQYQNAWYLFGTLISRLKFRYSMKLRPIVLAVPGNHDVDLSTGDLGHAKIQELTRSSQLDSEIESECSKLRNFFTFANGNDCFNPKEKLYFCKKIVIDDFIIEANLLNSAIFSTFDEDKGLHYLPQHIIDKISEPSGANFVISMMHHSPHWFNPQNKSQLEQILLSKSSLLFLGHEHNLTTQEISYNTNPSVRVLAGGELCNKGVWTNSEYFASVFDTENFMFSLFGFRWNSEENFYEQQLIETIQLPIKPSREKRLTPSYTFLKTFFEDEKHPITKDFTDYYVFPRLQFEEKNEQALSGEITDEKKFLKELEKLKKVIIVGNDNSGKTALLKQLFKSLSIEKVVLFCDVYSIRSGNCNRIIKSVFQDIYGDNQSDYIRFQQMSKQEKVLIIDDVHQVDGRNFNAFIQEAENIFDYIIYSTKNVVELDIHERAKKVVKQSYPRYRVMPFYTDKRNELISRVVRSKINDDSDEVANVLQDSLKKQRSLYNLNPDFIIQYTEYYCNNIKDAVQNDGEIFSKVFEANIVNLVLPHLKKIKVDKLFIILDKIAYFIHKNKSYPLSFENITNIINSYNEDYGSDVNIPEFIGILKSAKIITPCGNGLEFKFCNKNYLAYFVAREIKRKYHEEKDDSDLIDILNYSCFGINGDILLFLTYITDDPNMLRLILRISIELTSSWIEFDLNKGNIPYLTNVKPLEVTAPTPKQKELDKKAEIEHEKSADISNSLDPIDVYDYKEDDINQLFNQICRAFSLLSVISRCLPNFEHMMKKEDKESFVDMIYRLPNKIFYLWAAEVESHKEELIEFIKKMRENDYSRDKRLTDDDIIRLLQWDSMSLYLDILNTAIVYATKENTEQYLSRFNYNSGTTYSLQHLMILERREKILEFIKEAGIIYDSSKISMVETLVRRITRHILINSRNINLGEIQQLEEKYFSDQHTQKNLHKRVLLLRAQNKKKL